MYPKISLCNGKASELFDMLHKQHGVQKFMVISVQGEMYLAPVWGNHAGEVEAALLNPGAKFIGAGKTKSLMPSDFGSLPTVGGPVWDSSTCVGKYGRDRPKDNVEAERILREVTEILAQQ